MGWVLCASPAVLTEYCFFPAGGILMVTRILLGWQWQSRSDCFKLKDGFCEGCLRNRGPESREQELVPASDADLWPCDLGQAALVPPCISSAVYLFAMQFMLIILLSEISCKTGGAWTSQDHQWSPFLVLEFLSPSFVQGDTACL